MKRKIISILLGLAFGVSTVLLSGCWTTVKDDNPLVRSDPAAVYARVYFIRPRPERFMGMADNRVTIAANQQTLLKLVRGEFTYVDLKPGDVNIAITNQTTYGPSHTIKTMTRSRPFTFRAGQTYYIAVVPTDGEFRGVRFVPRTVDVDEARKMARRARAVGNAPSDAFATAASQ
jgi:hypothetical protein